MIKTTRPTDWDYGESPFHMVKMSRAGLIGNDLRSFIKRAGDEAACRVAKLDQHTRPGEDLLHLLAMGATEIISPNRNGDGWKQAILIKSHPTFTKFAHWHRNHKVEESDPVYGKVRDSWYNHKMGRVELLVGLFGTKSAAEAGHAKRGAVADKEIHMLDRGTEIPVSMSGFVPYDTCFKAGTLVETSTGMVPIETIKVGDLVRTHLGVLKQVTRVMKRAYAGTMVDLDVMGIPETISSTAEHPFLVTKKDVLRSCSRGYAHSRSVVKERMRHSLTEGSTCTHCRKEVEIERDWQSAESVGVGDYVTCPLVKPKETAVGLERAYLLGLYTGDGSLTKTRLKSSGEYRNYGISVTLGDTWPEIIDKTIRCAEAITGKKQKVYSTGSNDGVKKNASLVPIRSKELGAAAERLIGAYSNEKRLSEAVFDFDLDHRLEFLAGCVDSDGSVGNENQPGRISISTVNRSLAEQYKRMIQGLGCPAYVSVQKNDHGRAPKGSLLYVVSASPKLHSLLVGRSVKVSSKGNKKVTESRSRSVLADGYVHMPVVETRHYYDECDVYNLSVEDHESYVVHGVAVHNCSGCGHKARGRQEYCGPEVCKYGGLRYNIGRVHEDGHQLHADNPDTRFFDISGIFDEDRLVPDRQADRVAYVLGRMKSAAAERLELDTPLIVPWQIFEGGNWWVSKQARILPALIRFEKEQGTTYTGSALTSKLDGQVKSASTNRVLNSLAQKGICLSLSDFATVCGVDQNTAASAEGYSKTAFERLAKSYTFEDDLSQNPFRFDVQFPDVSGKALFSIDPESVRKRAWLEVGYQDTRSENPVEKNEAAEALSDLHALYRLGFAASLEKSAKMDLLFSTIARHNRFQ